VLVVGIRPVYGAQASGSVRCRVVRPQLGGPVVGQGEGRSVLDSIRAAHQLEGLRLDPQTVVWGHSQGGHAAL
jgi:hypothetical protein